MLQLDIFLIIYLLISSTASQWYALMHGPHFKHIRCREQRVSDLLQCAALGRESKDVRFFISIGNKYCRWNCTFIYEKQIQDREWNHYGVESKRNAVLLLSSTASSVYSNEPSLWGPGYATDGLHSLKRGTEIFASQWETSPWIMVTLDRLLLLSFVRVYNREDGDGDRFHDVAFEVSTHGTSFEQRGFFKGPGSNGQVVEILFDYPTVGQYVKIRITQGTRNLINISEIEVYAA